MVLVADVAGTTSANNAFWAEKCKAIPSTAIGIVIDTGFDRDFFKPTAGATYCEMLISSKKHQWSATGNDDDWVVPAFYGSHNGGSAPGWPKESGKEGDDRKHLTFWGRSDKSNNGGHTRSGWGSPFTMYYLASLQPPPPNTAVVLVADVAGTTTANDAYWADKCTAIPSTAIGIVVHVGAVRCILMCDPSFDIKV